MTEKDMYPLKFGGEIVAQPSEIGDWQPEKIWSANAGRASDCTAVGDIIDIKKTITLTWRDLTPAQVRQLNKYISSVDSNFFAMTLFDEELEYRTYMVYAATPSYTIWGWDKRRRICRQLTVELIQQ